MLNFDEIVYFNGELLKYLYEFQFSIKRHKLLFRESLFDQFDYEKLSLGIEVDSPEPDLLRQIDEHNFTYHLYQSSVPSIYHPPTSRLCRFFCPITSSL